MHWETALRGCHDEIGYLGLKRMFDLMHNHFVSPQMAIQAKKHVEKCHQCVTFKAKQQRTPMVTHPLELVHINYFCLEPGKGKEENILVVTGSNGPFHPLCPGICHLISDGPDNSQGPLGQFHHPLWVSRENPFRPGEEFWEWAHSQPLEINMDQEI